MEQITVPQFLDVEDKIIGAITVRQFLEMLIAGMIIFIFYKIFDFSLFVLSSIIVFAIAVVFAFVKINGQSFHNFLLNFVATLRNPKLKIWKKVVDTKEIKENLKKPVEKEIGVPKIKRQAITTSSLSELSLIVDTGGVYRGEGVSSVVNDTNKSKINI
jgi:hypothetical protein